MIYIGPNDLAVRALRKGLEDHGYVDGRNVQIAFRGAEGDIGRLPKLLGELIQLGADVIVVGNEPALRIAKQGTSSVPIVAALYDYDPVASGIIESYARPGGNVTGVFTHEPSLPAKRLELLREALPGASNVAVFWDSFGQRQLHDLEGAARAMGIKLQPIPLEAPYNFKQAFATLKKKNAAAAITLFSPAFYAQRVQIADESLRTRTPILFHFNAGTGELISYSADVKETYERLGYFIDRLLKGEMAADIPVEQTATFKLIVNLRTAKALGITLPESLVQRADEIIR